MLSLRRILILLGLVLIPVFFVVDGVTTCVGRGKITIINPRLRGEYREMVKAHEQGHRDQIDRYGCWGIMQIRRTREGRQMLEDEAISREVEYLSR